MVLILTDEDVALSVLSELRDLGHDVLTAHEAGLANKRIPDSELLARATDLGRVVLTMNRKDYRRLHRSGVQHAGIILSTRSSPQAVASRVHEALTTFPSLTNRCINVRADQVEEVSRGSRIFPERR